MNIAAPALLRPSRREQSRTTTTARRGVVTFPVTGCVDRSALAECIEVLRSSDRDTNELVVDLSTIDDLDGRGICALLDLHDAAAERGVLFRIVKTSERVRRRLEAAGVAARLGAR